MNSHLPAGPLILTPTLFEAGILFGPGVREDLALQPLAAASCAEYSFNVSICGFGLAAAGSGAAFAISAFRTAALRLPSALILVGIAGAYSPEARIGASLVATEVLCDGIGVGSQDTYLGPRDLGWPQSRPLKSMPPIYDRLPLAPPPVPPEAFRGPILSVAAASANAAEAASRRARFPAAIAEEMEAFSVGLTAALFGVPLIVLRGVSNHAGDREKSRWQVDEALASVSSQLAGLLQVITSRPSMPVDRRGETHEA